MVDANTGDPSPVLITERSLFTTVGHSDIDAVTASRVMGKAIDNGHVLRWEDTEGTPRYGVTSAGIDETPRVWGPLYSAADRERLAAIIETEVGRDEPDKRIVGWSNQRLAALEGSD
jgi:hypothetical protein